MKAIIQMDDGRRYGADIVDISRSRSDELIEFRGYLFDSFSSSNRYARFMDNVNRSTPSIKDVIFNDPATIVIWSDGSKTVVKCQPGDTYSKETGLALCIAKKYLGNKGNFNEVFKKWIPEEKKISDEEMRDELNNFCTGKSCSECPLKFPFCRCGNGTHFKHRYSDGRYEMSEDEIKAAYTIAFKKG